MAQYPFVAFSPLGQTKIATVQDVLAMPQFNMMYELNPATNSAMAAGCDPTQGTAFIKNLVRQIRAAGLPIETNFVRDLWGSTPTRVDTTDVYNAYYTDVDYNVVFAASVTGPEPGAPAWVQLIRSLHSGVNGEFSYPAVGFTIIDKDYNIIYQVTDVDTTIPNAHRFELTPWDADVTVEIRGGKKYFVNTARIVDGCSCPVPQNAIMNMPYVQRIQPLNIRRDWEICYEILKGYQNLFRFQTKFLADGTPVSAWDTYEAEKAREGVQIALNALMLFASPINNPLLLTGDTAITNARYGGFWGILPTLLASSNVIDYAPSEGFDLKSDLEPFILFQDSWKRSNRFLGLHGKAFKASLIDRTNQLVRNEGLDLFNFNAYNRSMDGDRADISKYGIDSYFHKGLNFNIDFKEVSAFSDQRFVGGDKLNNTCIFIAQDGTYDAETNQPVAPIELFQFGDKLTGDYYEEQRDNAKINGCLTLAGFSTESIMMALHNPELHFVANPEIFC
jgi:hypothetical protein